MAIENLPVWSIPPDWKDSVVESLEWLTAVLKSPLGVEQRFASRLSPRQSMEMSFTVHGPSRTFFDLLTIRASAEPVYVPFWFENEKLTADYIAGSNTIYMETDFTEFAKAKFVFLRGPDPFNYEIGEVDTMTGGHITLVDPLTLPWLKGSRVYPLKKCQMEIQPSTNRQADRAFTSRVRFRSLEANPSADEVVLNTYYKQYVLEQNPNEARDLTYIYSRVMSEIDNQTGTSKRYDVSGLMAQQFSWMAKGKIQQSTLRGLFYALQGRRVPIWIPSFYADFDLVDDISDDGLNVKRCGFTDMGGPSFNREHILIELKNGSRIYRQITDSALVGDGSVERLLLDSAPGSIARTTIKRISFLTLGRLDQDTIEIEHHTDTKGVSSVLAVFRSVVDRESMKDIETTTTGIAPSCLNDFQWATLQTSTGGADDPANCIDKFGNYYLAQYDAVRIYDSSGNLTSTMFQSDLADMIDTFHGSPIVDRRLIGGGFTVKPLLAGEYILAYKQSVFAYGSSSGHVDWWVVLRPVASGMPTFAGVVAVDELLGPPYLYYLHIIGLANGQTINDPILFRGASGIGGDEWDLGLLPSINDIVSGTYVLGYSGYSALTVPNIYFRPIGDDDFSTHMFFPTTARNTKSGFVLPNLSGGTNLYFYINRETMDWNATHSVGAGANPEIKNVLQPAYPNGCIVKIDLGSLNYVAVVTAGGGPTLHDYTVDNANWVDGDSLEQIPFDDEYVYISTGAAGGGDSYVMAVAPIKRADGKYWIIFYKPGIDDSIANTGGTLHDTIRVFEYDPATETATQIQKISCIVHTQSNIASGSGLSDSNQAIHATEVDGLVTLHINGYHVLPSLVGNVYLDRFCQFQIEVP